MGRFDVNKERQRSEGLWLISCLCVFGMNIHHTYRRLTSCAFTITLKSLPEQKISFFLDSAGFLPASLAPVISLSFSKTGAVEVLATLTAILELGILSSPASFSCSRNEAYTGGPPL